MGVYNQRTWDTYPTILGTHFGFTFGMTILNDLNREGWKDQPPGWVGKRSGEFTLMYGHGITRKNKGLKHWNLWILF